MVAPITRLNEDRHRADGYAPAFYTKLHEALVKIGVYAVLPSSRS